MNDALAKTPSLSQESGSTAQILGSLSKDQNLLAIRLLASDVEQYADHGYRSERPPSIGPGSFLARAIAVDAIADDAARQVALTRFRIDVVNDLQELETADDNIAKVLQSEPEFRKRIKAAQDLKAVIENPIVAEHLITETGLSLEAWSAINSNLANYIVNHEITLASLKTLQKSIADDHRESIGILKILDEAAARNARIGGSGDTAKKPQGAANVAPQPSNQPPARPPAQPSADAPPLLAPPGVAPPPKVDLLPGAPAPSQKLEPMAVAAALRNEMNGLLQTGEKLLSSSNGTTRDAIESFGKAEEAWRQRATFAWKHFTANGPDMARAAMDEILHADPQGGRLITIRHILGLP